MEKYACCAGYANSGGHPDCIIRICACEKGYELCSSSSDLDSCTKFEWLKEHGSQLRQKLAKIEVYPRKSTSKNNGSNAL